MAVCLSGSLRTFLDAYPTFKKHIEEPNPAFEFEFFGDFVTQAGDKREEI